MQTARADVDYNSTSKRAAALCGWSDKTALQCKNVNDQGCAAFDGRIYIEPSESVWKRLSGCMVVYGISQ